ncbi:MAG: murein biosynthesis integral membrane protein MurJ [Bacillus sp. (in: firmicutes)]
MSKLKKTALWSVMLALVLKFSGVIRESIIAKEYGASAETSGYYLAFTFITIILALVATGFNNVFLPMYIKRWQVHDKGLNRDANGVLTIIVIIFIVISFVGWKYASWFVPLIFPGMSSGVEVVAVQLTEIIFMFMSVIVLSLLLETYLQIHKIIVPSQVAKLAATVGSMVFAYFFSGVWGINAVIYGFVLGTILGTLLQITWLVKSDYVWRLSLYVDKNFSKEFIILLIPSLLNAGVGQVNFLVNKSFASGTGDASVTYLNNASTIVSMPNAIFATTIVTLIFTVMSEQATKDKRAFKDTFFKGMEISLIVLVPVTVGLLLVGDLVASVIYERGKFTEQDTHFTFMAMVWYMPIIVFQSMHLVLSKAMYAVGKTNVVFKISAFTIVLNLFLNYLLVDKYGYLSLAFATSVVSVYCVVASMIVVYKDLGVSELNRFWKMSFRVLVSALVMGIGVALIRYMLPIDGLFMLLQLLVLGATGVLVYMVALRFCYKAGFRRVLSLVKR